MQTLVGVFSVRSTVLAAYNFFAKYSFRGHSSKETDSSNFPFICIALVTFYILKQVQRLIVVVSVCERLRLGASHAAARLHHDLWQEFPDNAAVAVGGHDEDVLEDGRHTARLQLLLQRMFVG